MDHIPTISLVGFSHRISSLPVPVKSPTPAIFTDVEPWPINCQVGVLLFICHSPTRLLVGLSHSMSSVLSPSKSPTPAMFMVVEPCPICCQVGTLLLISQSPTNPLVGFSHRTSDVPLPVKSSGVGGTRKPLPVTSNTVPSPFAPPSSVVPNRSPAESAYSA